MPTLPGVASVTPHSVLQPETTILSKVSHRSSTYEHPSSQSGGGPACVDTDRAHATPEWKARAVLNRGLTVALPEFWRTKQIRPKQDRGSQHF